MEVTITGKVDPMGFLVLLSQKYGCFGLIAEGSVFRIELESRQIFSLKDKLDKIKPGVPLLVTGEINLKSFFGKYPSIRLHAIEFLREDI